MCGIAGIYNFNTAFVEKEQLVRFTDSMYHRGPDGAGYELLDEGFLGLGQRRLSILDLSDAGKQPMTYADGRYWITYNGEIFNFNEVKEELLQLGHRFKSETDTEVILASFACWGKACLDKFNGMWAFAIWDDANKELFLARDRFGIKPLYYLHKPDRFFAFASETRAFKFLEGFQREFDEELLQLNLQDSYALEGLGYTPFKNILQVLPGHFMVVSRGKQEIKQKRWWHINDHLHTEIPETLEAQAEKFYELFRDACRLRLVSDVPVATALSGGLDSSAVYSTVYDILKTESLGRVSKDSQRAFCAIFPGLQTDESEFAIQATKYTNGNLNFFTNELTELPYTIEKETELFDSILASPISSISPVYRGMRKEGVLVSLDGHGVDEMLYGYRDTVRALFEYSLKMKSYEDTETYKDVLYALYHKDQSNGVKLKLENRINLQKDNDKKRVKNFLKNLKSKLQNINNDKESLSVAKTNLTSEGYDFSQLPFKDKILFNQFFITTLPTLLRNFDRASMINSVEIRMPFMDWRLVTYVFSLPSESKIGKGFTKLILRQAMKSKMDEEIRQRRFKVGVGSPLKDWFNKPLKTWALDTLGTYDIEQKKILEKYYIDGEKNAQLLIETWLKINKNLIS